MRKLNNFLDKKNKVIIITKPVQSHTDASNIIFLSKKLKEIKKRSELVITGLVKMPALALFKKHEIKINHKINFDSYIIAVNYGDKKIDKISYDIDEKNSQILFHIYPEDGFFDFKNISYENASADFDGAIFYEGQEGEEIANIGAKDKKMLKKLPKLFLRKEDFDISKLVKESLSKNLASILLDEFVYSKNFVDGYEKTKDNTKTLDSLVKMCQTPIALYNSIKNLDRLKSPESINAYNRLISKAPFYQEYSQNKEIFLTIFNVEETETKLAKFFNKLIKNPVRINDFFKFKIPYMTSSETILNILAVTGMDKSIVKMESAYKSRFNLKKVINIIGGSRNSCCATILMDKMSAEQAPEIIANLIKEMYN